VFREEPKGRRGWKHYIFREGRVGKTPRAAESGIPDKKALSCEGGATRRAALGVQKGGRGDAYRNVRSDKKKSDSSKFRNS